MSKLSSISLLLALVAVCVALYHREESMYARQAMRTYQGNNEVLIGRLKKVYADKVEVDRRNAALEKAAAEDKTGFDWHYNISRSSVIMRLQAR